MGTVGWHGSSVLSSFSLPRVYCPPDLRKSLSKRQACCRESGGKEHDRADGASVGDSPTMIRLHARHAQRALEQTLEASKTDNVELEAQVYLNHTSGCISQRWLILFSRRVAVPSVQQICSLSLPSDVRRNSRKKSRRVSRGTIAARLLG